MQTRDKGGGEDCNDVCTDEIDVDEGAVNCDVGVASAAGVEAAEPSVGVSKPDGEVETKLSFFFRNSLLHLERGVGELEIECLALAGQCLAKNQTLGYQGGVHFSSHFHLFF